MFLDKLFGRKSDDNPAADRELLTPRPSGDPPWWSPEVSEAFRERLRKPGHVRVERNESGTRFVVTDSRVDDARKAVEAAVGAYNDSRNVPPSELSAGALATASRSAQNALDSLVAYPGPDNADVVSLLQRLFDLAEGGCGTAGIHGTELLLTRINGLSYWPVSPRDPELAEKAVALGSAVRQINRPDAAIGPLKTGLAIRRATEGDGAFATGVAAYELGHAFTNFRMPAEAADAYRVALNAYTAQGVAANAADAARALAHQLISLGQIEEAREVADRAQGAGEALDQTDGREVTTIVSGGGMMRVHGATSFTTHLICHACQSEYTFTNSNAPNGFACEKCGSTEFSSWASM